MKKIIIYGSIYGSTKLYADELSKRTGIKSVTYKEIKNLSVYETIIYLGGLYAGGVLGLSKTLHNLSLKNGQTLIIVTIGLGDPTDIININHIKDSIHKQISKEIYEKAKIFHLRGSIHYKNLNRIHKVMMKMLYYKISSIPPENQTAENQTFIQTYNKKVEFVDFNTLNQIIDCIENKE